MENQGFKFIEESVDMATSCEEVGFVIQDSITENSFVVHINGKIIRVSMEEIGDCPDSL